MHDQVETLACGSLIQHGKHNDRIYLMKSGEGDARMTLSALQELAEKHNYTKLFCKVPASKALVFVADGFIKEASIPGFYNAREDALFLGKFLEPQRQEVDGLEEFQRFLSAYNHAATQKKSLPAEFTLRRLGESDVQGIVDIYKEIFKSYPFPIHDPAYILSTMEDNVQYYGAESNGRLAAVSSAEIDFKGANAEMTDFATSAAFQGNSLASFLLERMETDMHAQGIKTLYTIARLKSLAMNKTFLKAGYQFSGTLVNNTNIAGNIESMNIYYKHL